MQNSIDFAIANVLSNGQSFGSDLVKLCKYLNIRLNAICFKDQLAAMHPRKGAYIINMADSGNSGTHWVAFCNFEITGCYHNRIG